MESFVLLFKKAPIDYFQAFKLCWSKIDTDANSYFNLLSIKIFFCSGFQTFGDIYHQLADSCCCCFNPAWLTLF